VTAPVDELEDSGGEGAAGAGEQAAAAAAAGAGGRVRGLLCCASTDDEYKARHGAQVYLNTAFIAPE
jgi:hypothetical protein